jgi:uncharacterized protein YoxC
MTVGDVLSLITIVLAVGSVLLVAGKLINRLDRLCADVRELSKSIEKLEHRLHHHETRLAVLEAQRKSS